MFQIQKVYHTYNLELFNKELTNLINHFYFKSYLLKAQEIPNIKTEKTLMFMFNNLL